VVIVHTPAELSCHLENLMHANRLGPVAQNGSGPAE
jgi:hypothetical protein